MSSLTDLTEKQKFLEAYKASKCNISKACESINITRQTFYNWKEKYPTFAKSCQEIEDGLDDKIEQILVRNAEKGHQRAVEFWLTNHKKDKYANLNKTELTGKDGTPLLYKEIVYNPEDECQK